MGAYASLGLLADAASSLQSFVTVFTSLYILFILAYVLMSWIQLPYSTVAATVQRFLDEICRPYLGLFRGRIPTLGPLDLSPLVAVFVLLGSLTIILPVIAYLVMADRSASLLDEVKTWMQEHNAAIMLVLFLVLGVNLIGDGISSL